MKMQNNRDCNKCLWSRRDGGCNSWECEFIAQIKAAESVKASAQPCADCVAYETGWTDAEAKFWANQRWIPCSERLPEEDGLYLVTTSKRQVQMHVFSRNGNSEEYWMRCNKAWRPLPAPWGGEKE